MNNNKDEKINAQIEEIEDDIKDFQDKSEKKNLQSVANLFRKVRSVGDVDKKCYMFGRALGRLWGIYKNRPSNRWIKFDNFLSKSRYSGIGPLAKEIKKFAKSSSEKTDLKSFNKIIKILQQTVNRRRSVLNYSEIPEAITGLIETEVNAEKYKKIRSRWKGKRLLINFGAILASLLTCDVPLIFTDKYIHSKYMFGDENEIDRKIAELIVEKNFDKMKEGILFEYKKISSVIKKQSKTFESLLKERESFLNK